MTCNDCGLSYGDEGFQDLVVPHDIWEKISPTGDEGGLLCPSCMCRRAAEAGVQCQATFRSGPFAVDLTLEEHLEKISQAAEAYKQDPVDAFDKMSSWEKLDKLLKLATGSSSS